jgi:hypothetical protein
VPPGPYEQVNYTPQDNEQAQRCGERTYDEADVEGVPDLSSELSMSLVEPSSLENNP